ncbi:MAG: PHP domain-containing protein [Clostridia bacterium]|nr:PHP domain-containing protein [Clostridia bacterium]
MRNCVDLHTHSVYSDGTYTPTELVAMAEAAGLNAVALTDHNTVAGLAEFLAAASERSVEAVPGVEFSVDYQGRELHVLGLFIEPEAYGEITARMAEGCRRKEESNVALIVALAKDGYRLDYARIKGATPGGMVNRAHIAAAMVEAGYIASVQDAFRTLLAPGNGYYTPPTRIDAFEVIAMIRRLGGVSVLAHPWLSLKEERDFRTFLERAKPCGLDGMETTYSLFDAEQTARLESIADEFDLLRSGGSDFHGGTKPYLALGTGKGNLQIPAQYYFELKARKKSLMEEKR